jgi:Flp pilus assembly pilin Flp
MGLEPLKNLWSEDEGQDLLEYALLVVLIVLASVASITQFANILSNYIQAAGNRVAQSP